MRRVWLLGGLRVEHKQTAIQLSGGKTRGLFASLMLHPAAPQPRDVLGDRLWPEAPADRVRRNLSDSLYRLRQALGPDWLILETETVGVRPGPDLWIDAWEFERLCAVGDPASLRQAVALYSGDLLPEFYDDWLMAPRVLLREKYLDSRLRLGRIAEEHDQPGTAFEHYHHLAQADPLREEAQRGLMRSLARQGKFDEALEAHARLEAALRDELDTPPTAETQALAETLRSERELSRAAAQGPGAFAPAPFVGRVGERVRFLARLDEARAARGGLLVVLGESGVGKTRLLQEFDRAASWRGWQVVWGRADEFGLSAPLAPLTPLSAALSAALPKPRLQQLAQFVPPAWLAAVAGLLSQAAAPAQPAPAALDPAQLPVAIRRLLAGLQQIAPHLLILDDVQWADAAVWPLLEGLRESLGALSLLIVVSGRPEELRSQPAAWSTVEGWDRTGVPVVHLAGLNRDELRELVTVPGRRVLSQDDLDRLDTLSGGNPLLALALVRSGDPADLIQELSLAELMQRRLDRLPERTLRALQAAAVIGYRFDYLLWQAVVDGHLPQPRDLPRLASELEQAGLLALEAEGYRFAHDTLRAHTYSRLPAPLRAELHRQALAAWSRYAPDDALARLHHAQQAGDQAAVAACALQAGQQALNGFAYESAADLFAAALNALSPGDLRPRFEATLGHIIALEALARRDAQQQALARLGELAEALDDDGLRAEAAQRWATYYWQTGAYAQTEAEAERGLALARALGDAEREAGLLHVLGRATRDLGRYDQAHALGVQAQTLYRALGRPAGEAHAMDLLGGLAWQKGDHGAAARLHARAAELFRSVGDFFREAHSLNNLGSVLWSLGDYVQARAVHERALAVCRELGNRRGEADNLDNLGGVAWVLGDYDTAINLYSQALSLRRAANDRWGISISLGNLGSAHRLAGDLDRALAAFDEALAANREIGRRRGAGYALHGRGLALLELGRLDEARQALEAAHALRVELGERDNLVETRAALAQLCLAAGDRPQAQTFIGQALAELADADRPALAQQVHFAAYQVALARDEQEAASRHLRQAQAAMQTIAEALAPAERERFLQRVPLNRQVSAALTTLARTATVRLARAGVPLGRRLTEQDYVSVQWTIHAPEDDQFAEAADRRAHVLRRLLAEAGAQGAAPTDDDLARALGVSRRTILRDKEALAAAGAAFPTRRRRSPRGS